MDAPTTFEEWARRVMRYADAKGVPDDEKTRGRFLADTMPWSIAEELELRFCEGIAAYMLGEETPADLVVQAGYKMMEKDDDRAWPRSAERRYFEAKETDDQH